MRGSIQTNFRAGVAVTMIRRISAFNFWFLLFVSTLHAQVPQPQATPNLQLMTNGTVTAMAAAPDGSVVFGGNFSYVNGIPRQRLARLLPDGRLDPNWNPGADYLVNAIGIDEVGAIYVGGLFTYIGGVRSPTLAKLDSTGAVDASWGPFYGGQIVCITPHYPFIYVAGEFSSLGNQEHHFIARISTAGTGAVDSSWNPVPDYNVYSIAVDDDGSVFIAGSFSIGADSHRGLAKLSPIDGSVDPLWRADTISQPGSIVTGHNGSIYVATGAPSDLGGGLSSIVKLSALNGSVDDAWHPAPHSESHVVAVDGVGHIYAGGSGPSYSSDPFSQELLAKLPLSGDGAIVSQWNQPNTATDNLRDNFATTIAVTSSKVIVGGNFVQVGGQTRLGIAAFSLTGDPLPPIDAGNPGTVYALHKRQDGSIIVGGDFALAKVATPRHNILRLNQDGTLDDQWVPSFEAPVRALGSDEAGALYVAGDFSYANGTTRSGLAKLSGQQADFVDANWTNQSGFLDSVGAGRIYSIAAAPADALFVGGLGVHKVSAVTGIIDSTWVSSPNSAIVSLALDANNDVILAGSFFTVGDARRDGFARVANSTGALDETWDPAFESNSMGLSVLLDPSGKLYLGGSFSQLHGVPRPELARVSAVGAGTVDPTWSPDTGFGSIGVMSFALSPTGDVFATGSGMQHDNVILGGLIKYSPTGVSEISWHPTANGKILASVIGDDGNLYIGGSFTDVSGSPRFGIASLPPQAPDPIFSDGFDGMEDQLRMR